MVANGRSPEPDFAFPLRHKISTDHRGIESRTVLALDQNDRARHTSLDVAFELVVVRDERPWHDELHPPGVSRDVLAKFSQQEPSSSEVKVPDRVWHRRVVPIEINSSPGICAGRNLSPRLKPSRLDDNLLHN